MLSKILAKAALKAHKFQAEFLFQRLEMMSSPPSSKLSISIKTGQQHLESLQRPKALSETILNESLILVTSIFYEEFKQKYQEKQVQIEVNLHNGPTAHSIGYYKIDLAQFGVLALEKPYENDIILAMEKSPDHQARLSLHLTLKYIGEDENSSSLLKKLKNSNNSSTNSNKESTGKLNIKTTGSAMLTRPKRSLTPTPKSSLSQTKSAYNSRFSNNRDVNVIKQTKTPDRSKSRDKTPNKNKFLQVANTVLLMKNTTTTMVKRAASKSPQPRKETFKPLIIAGPLFQNKYSNIFEDKTRIEGKIKEIKELKNTSEDQVNAITKALEKNERESEEVLQRIKEFELKNSRMRKEIEKNKVELKKTKEIILKNLEQGDKKEKIVENQEKKQILENFVKNDLFEKIGKKEIISEKIEKPDQNAMIINSKYSDIQVDYQRLSNEKTSIQSDVTAIKQENQELLGSIQELTKLNESKNILIESINKKQMDLKNEYLNLKNKQPNILNRNKIEDLFGDSYKHLKEIEVQSNNLVKSINESNTEFNNNEAKLVDDDIKIGVLKESIPAHMSEREKLEEGLKELEGNIEKFKSELEKLEKKKVEIMESTLAHQDGYVKTKQDIADILNLVFERGGDDLMDEMERFFN